MSAATVSRATRDAFADRSVDGGQEQLQGTTERPDRTGRTIGDHDQHRPPWPDRGRGQSKAGFSPGPP